MFPITALFFFKTSRGILPSVESVTWACETRFGEDARREEWEYRILHVGERLGIGEEDAVHGRREDVCDVK
jgi:hypothetical protein